MNKVYIVKTRHEYIDQDGDIVGIFDKKEEANRVLSMINHIKDNDKESFTNKYWYGDFYISVEDLYPTADSWMNNSRKYISWTNRKR